MVETSVKVLVAGPMIRNTESTVEGTGVTMKAEVDPNGQNTNCHFEYGPVGEEFGAGSKQVACPKAPGEGETFVAESAKAGGLAPGEYHFRFVANETDGETKTFVIAQAGAPLAETLAPSDVAITAATLNGAVNPEGHTTTCKFEYGTASVSEHSEACATPPGAGIGSIKEALPVTGLSPGTTYRFRITAENSEGKTASGGELTFSTAVRVAPSAETSAVSSVTQTSATLTGKVNPHGEVTKCKFVYGPTTAYGQEAPCASSPGEGFAPVSVTATISGLSPGTVYHYKVVAENAVGPASGVDQELRTLTPPVTPVEPPPGKVEVKGIIEEAMPTVSVAGSSLTVASNGGIQRQAVVSSRAESVLRDGDPEDPDGGIGGCGPRGTKKAILTLASGSFTIAGGKVKVLSLHLSAKARTLLSKAHSLRARLTIAARNPQGKTHTTSAVVTLKAAKKKHH